MPLEPGLRLGGYDVLALLGVGGMGEVYRARDPKLQRDVAIKALPPQFADDPERITRFEREAQALAALNHSGIAGIHELLEHDGARYLVLEFVDGESLDARIRRGPMPLDEALPVACQIAEALEAAHDKGIVHRDLKPANIMLTADGRAKILDFGLAKALDANAAASTPALSQSPTLVTMTAGVILGTAAYMSPEQARGKPVDRRADIWAFGCVLYEMLTGTQAFGGETVSDTIGAIMRAEPDWARLPADTPANIRVLLQRSLRKDARERLPHLGAARLELREPQPTTPVQSPGARRGGMLPWAIAAVLASALVAVGAFVWARDPMPSGGVVRFDIRPAEDTATLGHAVPQRGTAPPAPHYAVSPDGRQIAYVMSQAGSVNLWLRALSSVESRMLPRTEDASFPFWSPDGREIGFFTATTLKKITLADGAVMPLCGVENSEGGTWLADDTLLFASSRGAIWRVSADGGTPMQVTSPQAGRLHGWPQALPGRNEFLYMERQLGTAPRLSARWRSLDTAEDAEILETQGRVMYAGGQLFYPQGGQLLMQPFDLASRQLQSKPRIAVPDLAINLNGRAGFFVTDSGILLYRESGGSALNRLVWRTRDGADTVEVDRDKTFSRVALSPDGTRAVAQISASSTTGQVADLWIYDLVRNVPTRFTSEAGFESFPVWSPDGKLVAYSSATTASVADATVWVKPAGGGEAARQVSKRAGVPRAFTPDGRSLIVSSSSDGGVILSIQPLDGGEPTLLIRNAAEVAISPDGAWMAYTSTDAAINDVYLQSFPPRGDKWRVSVNGGVDPHWSADGRELFYVVTGDVMGVPFDGNPARLPRPTLIFKQILPGPAFVIGTGAPRFGVAPDRKRFLMIDIPVGITRSTPLTVIVNWPALHQEP